MKIRLCAFADEASSNFSEQIKTLREENISYIELRGLDGKNVSELTNEEAKRYKEMLDQGGIAVWAIGSPLGKIGVQEDFSMHLQKAKRVFDLARIFGTRKIRVFSFYTSEPDKDEDKVFHKMRLMAQLADECGVTLYHENEKEIYGDTVARCIRLLDAIPQLQCIFDPANFVQCGENAVVALKRLSGRIGYYHIKDSLADGTIVPAGEGVCNISEMIAEIYADTVLTLEPHLTVFDGYASIDKSTLKNKYTFDTPRNAFSAAAKALRSLINKNLFQEVNGQWIK